MNIHANKSQENKSQSVSNIESQNQSGAESTFQPVDNRVEAVAQRKLQDLANNSQQVSQLKSFQEMANNSPHTQQAIQLKSGSNNVVQLGAFGRIGKETLKGAVSGAAGGAVIGAVGGTTVAPGIGTAAGAGMGALGGGVIGGIAGAASGITDEVTGYFGMGKDKDKDAPIKAQQSALKDVEDKNIQKSLISMGQKVSKNEEGIKSHEADITSLKGDVRNLVFNK